MNREKLLKATENMRLIVKSYINGSCATCMSNAVCGVYSFLKNVKGEDDKIDFFMCNHYIKFELKE